ncbi:uracil-DNA glycosylase [Acidithiobacillus acidisediminis]|uniref:uracil-DNA glycosylase n=1 Tax=Acidithiobacillus acidisediminis TaxID=2937799 RepID=UPI00200D0D24|nr:uracil-DNA glycosylase [Acidithiobacillus sp. S30A2]
MISDCTRCPSLCASRTQVVMPDLPDFGRSCRLLVIGEAPGADEDAQGKGFVGRAGRTLHRLLEEYGLRRGYDYGCANIVRCRPEGNRKPTNQEIANCLPYLAGTIANARPEVVLTVGATAIAALTGIAKLESNIGTLDANGHDPQKAACLYREDLRAAWPRGARLYAMPHTSPLAWNRNAPDGRKWSAIGEEVVRKAASFLRAKPTIPG